MTFSPHKRYRYSFLVIGLIILILTRSAPIADFGNYYYGSKLLSEGKFTVEDYKSIHHFNEQIKSYDETNFFENYTPVPPFSLLFYLPFVALKANTAKLVFNLVSLVLFCFSLQRLLTYKSIESKATIFLPLIVMYPLYINLLQGQSYLLICTLMIESYLAHSKRQIVLSAFWFSLAFCLKIFTGFVLLYFILKKDLRCVALSAGWVFLLCITTYLCIDHHILPYYLEEVLPRLAANEILEPYHYSGQGLHTFLMKLFSLDALQNPMPLINSSFILVVIESFFVAFIISGITELSKKMSDFFLFSFILFSTFLVMRHSAGYSLLIVVPFCITLLNEREIRNKLIYLSLILLAVNLPASLLSSQFTVLQFLRLWLFLFVFIVVLISFKPQLNYALMVFIFGMFSGLSYFFSEKESSLYFAYQNSKGALYDYEFVNNTLHLHSCYGGNDFTESFSFAGNIAADPEIELKENNLYYKQKLICESTDHKLKPMLLNDTSILFLSDLKQGIGFYRLRMIRLQTN